MQGLFEREPLAWGTETLGAIAEWLLNLPASAAEAVRSGLVERGITPVYGLWFLVLLAVLALVHYLFDRKARQAGDELVARRGEQWGQRRAHVFSALATVALSCLAPLVFWGILLLTDALMAGPNPLLEGLAALARLYLVSALILLALRESLGHEVLYIRSSEVRPLAFGVWCLVLYVVVLRVLMLTVNGLGGRADVVAFLRFLLMAGIILGLGLLFLNRRFILANLPNVHNRIYNRFLRGFYRVYYLAWFLSLAMGVLWLVGYVEFAQRLLLRSWAVVGLFIGLIYLDQILKRGLRVMLEQPEAEDDDVRQAAEGLATNTFHMVRFLEWFGGGVAFLALVGLLAPLVEWLTVPLFHLKDQSITALLLLQSGLVLVIVMLLVRVVERILDAVVFPKVDLDSGVAKAITTGIKVLLLVLGFFIVLETAGLDLTTLKVFAGALGIGVGLGLQRIASNLASGMIIVFGRIIRKGDVVTVGETVGRVREIGLRATVMKSLDNIEYMVPNEHFINEKIVNWTYSDPLVRVHVPMGVSYKSDPEQAKELMMGIARGHPEVRKVPGPSVWFTGYGDSSIDFNVLVWIDIRRISVGQIKSDIYFGCFKAFREAGVEIPFPQRDLHLKSGWPPGASPGETDDPTGS